MSTVGNGASNNACTHRSVCNTELTSSFAGDAEFPSPQNSPGFSVEHLELVLKGIDVYLVEQKLHGGVVEVFLVRFLVTNNEFFLWHKMLAVHSRWSCAEPVTAVSLVSLSGRGALRYGNTVSHVCVYPKRILVANKSIAVVKYPRLGSVMNIIKPPLVRARALDRNDGDSG